MYAIINIILNNVERSDILNPTAFSIFGFEIKWYGILIGSGMLLGIIIANYTSKLRNIIYDELLNIVLITLPVAILCARLYYVIFNFSYYTRNITDILNIRQGGLAIHGGVIGGFLCAYIYTYHKKINFLAVGDVVAPSLILAQSIGRWGNFFNSEAHGGPVSYAFIKHFPAFIQRGMHIDGIYYHPTFLYESIWDFCVFLTLIIMLKNSSKIGLILFSYIGLYSIGRFFIEGLRTDSLMLGPLRIAQVVSLCGIIIWITALIFMFKKKSSSEK